MPGVMATNRTRGEVRVFARLRSRAGAFTLIDVLVSLTVIAILIALMLPSLSGVRETTRRVVCSSNTRQIGLGLAMYVEDYKGQYPISYFEAKPSGSVAQPQMMMLARLGFWAGAWDGLGILYASDYLAAPQVFYCPSHRGEHPYREYAETWNQSLGQVMMNYHYRGSTTHAISLPSRFAVVADGLRTRLDYNHKVGSNVLRADFSVGWFGDAGGQLARALPESDADFTAADKVGSAWVILDQPLAEDRISAPPSYPTP